MAPSAVLQLSILPSNAARSTRAGHRPGNLNCAAQWSSEKLMPWTISRHEGRGGTSARLCISCMQLQHPSLPGDIISAMAGESCCNRLTLHRCSMTAPLSLMFLSSASYVRLFVARHWPPDSLQNRSIAPDAYVYILYLSNKNVHISSCILYSCIKQNLASLSSRLP